MLPSFKNYKRVVVLLVATLLGACSGTTDEEKVGDAQFCLDEIPLGLSTQVRTTRVNTCIAKLGSVNSASANLIRCSGNFLIEGFSEPATITDIMNKLGDQQANSGTVVMMQALAFDSQGDTASNQAFATETFNYCEASGSPGYTLVASFSKMATALSEVASIFDDGQLSQTEIDQLATQTPAVIGATAQAAYQASCSGDQANVELCTQLGNAIQSSNGDSTVIGQSLLNAWKNQ